MASGRARLPSIPTAASPNNVRHVEISPNTNYQNPVNITEDTINALDNLSDHERQIILNVLNRDENVRQRDAARIM
jgi:hypothetical protein